MEFYILGIPLSKFRGVFQRKKKKSSAHTAEKKEKKRVPSELRKHENSREEQKQEVKIIEESDNVPVEIISADFEGTDIEGDSRKEATEGVCEFQNKDNENADKTSETTLIAYGNSSSLGITGTNAFSANAPCPISLLPGPLDGLASPTL